MELHLNKELFKDFSYLKQEFSKELLQAFENMQNKYVLNDKYKIDINQVKGALDLIKNNKNVTV